MQKEKKERKKRKRKNKDKIKKVHSFQGPSTMTNNFHQA